MYTNAFEKAVNHAMLYEVGAFWKLTPDVEAGVIRTSAQRRACGYVNDPTDLGGETKFGVAKNANMDLNITTLTWEQAKAVYFKRYWLAGYCDKLSPRLSVLHFDGCTNHGVGRASKFLQRAADVDDDGRIGPATIAAVEAMDEIELCESICDQRAKFYNDIVASNPPQKRFLNGWMRRIEEMRAYTTDPENDFAE